MTVTLTVPFRNIGHRAYLPLSPQNDIKDAKCIVISL